MTAQDVRYRWTPEAFLRADAAGISDGRVELVDGEVWPVVLGDWHGPTTVRCLLLLHAPELLVTQHTLPTGQSLPDPDVWVRRRDARAAGSVSPRLRRWDPADVLLVVEVSDETVAAELGIKARLYATAGFPSRQAMRKRSSDSISDLPGPRRSSAGGGARAGCGGASRCGTVIGSANM